MLIETLSTFMNQMRKTNTTDSSYPSRVPQVATPSGIGDNAAQTTSAVFALGDGGQHCQNAALIIPFGTGSDNQTMNMKVLGWYLFGQQTPNKQVWVPVEFCELAVTLGAATGPAASLIPTTMLFADELVVTKGNQGVSIDVVSPSGDNIAHALVDLQGARFLEIVFNTNSSATDCNALFALM
jgi:hypothetical protein